MKMKTHHLIKSVVLLSGFTSGALGVAVAQTASPAAAANNETVEKATTLETVVVTGLSRKQGLQTAPNAINVLDGSSLRDKGSSGFQDYLQSVPGVNFTQNNLGASRVTIRGVSDGIGATDALSTVYLDDLPITENFGDTFDPAIYDIARVEVLKGPQGTLYGAGSMGGTVRVVGKRPVLDQREFIVDAGMGATSHGGGDRRVDGVMNLPLVSDLAALRISVGSRKNAGWIDDVLRHQKDGNDLRRDNARAQLLLQPSPDTSVVLGFLYQKDQAGLPPYEDVNRGEYQTGRIFRASSKAQSHATTLTIEHDWDFASLTSATNVLSKESSRADDASSSLRRLIPRLYPITLGDNEGIGLESQDKFRLFTQEVRLTSSGKKLIDWVVGGYYSNAKTDYHQQFDFTQAPTAAAVVSGPGFYDALQKYQTKQKAAFGEVTYNATEKLSLVFGLRVSGVDQHNIVAGSGTLNGGTTLKDLSGDDSSTNKKFLAKYQVNNDHMLYASGAQGYRNGGPTGGIPVTACGQDAAALGYSTIPSSYKADHLWDYELGSKNTLLDGRLNINASVYRIDWDDIQTSVPLTCGFSFITNSGKAKSTGGELEFSAQPVRELTLSASASYVDAKLVRSASGSTAKAGNELPLTSRWSGNVGAQYTQPLGSGYVGWLGADLSYIGGRWTMFEAVSGSKRLEGYTLVGLRLGVRKDNWSVYGFVNNLTDKHYVINENITANPAYRTVGRPRSVALNAKVTF